MLIAMECEPDRNEKTESGGWRRKCRSVVSARGVKPHTGAGGDFWSVGGGSINRVSVPSIFSQ